MIRPEQDQQGRWYLEVKLKVGGKEESARERELLPPDAECAFIATFLALATS